MSRYWINTFTLCLKKSIWIDVFLICYHAEYVRGKEHANLLFPLLKRLATSEETAVREEAINSLKVIASGLGELQLRTEFIPKVVVVLASDDKSITSRKSACALLTTRYEEVPKESKNYLKCAFMTLCRDSEMEVCISNRTHFDRIRNNSKWYQSRER